MTLVAAESVAVQPLANGRQSNALVSLPDNMDDGSRVTPLTPIAASNPASQPGKHPGYYVRRRDEYRTANPDLVTGRVAEGSKPVRVRPVGSVSEPTNTARPQPPQTAEQVIIEWSRPAPSTVWR